MSYDARAGRIGLSPGGNGYVAGGNRQSTCESPKPAPVTGTAWVGRCSPVTAALPLQSQRRPAERASSPRRVTASPPSIARTRSSAAGSARFPATTSTIARERYMQTPTGWKLTTAAGVDQTKIPAPVVQGFSPDIWNVILPTVPAPTLPVTDSEVHRQSSVFELPVARNGKTARRTTTPGRAIELYSADTRRQPLRRRAHHLQAGQHSSRLSALRREPRRGAAFLPAEIRGADASFDSDPLTGPCNAAAAGYGSRHRDWRVLERDRERCDRRGCCPPDRGRRSKNCQHRLNGVVTSIGALLARGAKTSVTLLTAGDASQRPPRLTHPS